MNIIKSNRYPQASVINYYTNTHMIKLDISSQMYNMHYYYGRSGRSRYVLTELKL